MDRRSFLTTSGLAATAPWLATVPAAHAAPADGGLFSRINFTSDGLGLDPREYSTLLHEMTTAGVQPDGYSNGGLIADLEQRFAERLGKPAAMFVPTGTLANHIAVRTLAGNDRRVLVQAESHLYNDSGDGAGQLSGLTLVPLAAGEPTLSLDEVRHWVERTSTGRVRMRVGAISIENPVRRCDHRMVDVSELERVCAYARAQGIRLHLDGARMFNLPQHSGRSVRDYAALFDSVYVSLWKHFNGMSGAILAGDTDFIKDLYHVRRMFGGSLPYAWPSVAPVARYLDSYESDYARAWHAAEALFAQLNASGQFRIRRLQDGTSRVFLKPLAGDPQTLRTRAGDQGIVLSQAHPEAGEFALEINSTLLRKPPAAVARTLIQAVRG